MGGGIGQEDAGGSSSSERPAFGDKVGCGKDEVLGEREGAGIIVGWSR